MRPVAVRPRDTPALFWPVDGRTLRTFRSTVWRDTGVCVLPSVSREDWSNDDTDILGGLASVRTLGTSA